MNRVGSRSVLTTTRLTQSQAGSRSIPFGYIKKKNTRFASSTYRLLGVSELHGWAMIGVYTIVRAHLDARAARVMTDSDPKLSSQNIPVTRTQQYSYALI